MLILNPDLDLWNFDPKIHCWANLDPKSQSCPFCLKIGTHSISRMLIPNPDLGFWSFDPKIHFGANLDPKIQSCLFCLKIGALRISRMLIPNPNLDFWNFASKNPKSIFGQIWYTSQGCWFLFQHYFSEFQILISFLGKFGPKKSKLSSLVENWHTECLDDFNSYSDIIFLSFEPWILFWTNLGRKIESCSFWLKIGTHDISRMLILLPTIVFWIANPRSTFGKIWAERVKAVCFAWKLAHTQMHIQYLEDIDSYFDIRFLKFQT